MGGEKAGIAPGLSLREEEERVRHGCPWFAMVRLGCGSTPWAVGLVEFSVSLVSPTVSRPADEAVVSAQLVRLGL